MVHKHFFMEVQGVSLLAAGSRHENQTGGNFKFLLTHNLAFRPLIRGHNATGEALDEVHRFGDEILIRCVELIKSISLQPVDQISEPLFAKAADVVPGHVPEKAVIASGPSGARAHRLRNSGTARMMKDHLVERKGYSSSSGHRLPADNFCCDVGISDCLHLSSALWAFEMAVNHVVPAGRVRASELGEALDLRA